MVEEETVPDTLAKEEFQVLVDTFSERLEELEVNPTGHTLVEMKGQWVVITLTSIGWQRVAIESEHFTVRPQKSFCDKRHHNSS